MRVFLFTFLLSFQANAIENELLPFTTDGCSKFPDINLTNCCKVHDLAYWKGGTEVEREASDEKLAACVKEIINPFFGSMFYWGVRVGGSPALATSFRWGYGWIYNRSYAPLNAQEKKMASSLGPEDPTKVSISTPKLSLKKRPVLFGNYCFDQIHEQLKTKLKNKKVVIETFRDGYQVVVKVELEKSNILFTYKNSKWKECHMPLYEAKLPQFYKAVYFE